MSSTSKHHHELTDGKGKCSVPMWRNNFPDGFCDNDAFGKPTTSPKIWNAQRGRYERTDFKYDGYVPGLACPMHAGPKCPGIEIEPDVFSDERGNTP